MESGIKEGKNVVKTAADFNEKYKEFLEDTFDGLDIEDIKVILFLDSIFETALTKIPNFKYLQIKLKFGQACFYSTLGSLDLAVMIEDRINALITE